MQLPPFMKSRKFWALLIGAAIVVLRTYVPGLPLTDDQLTTLGLLIVAYIIGSGLEEAARANDLRAALRSVHSGETDRRS